MAIAGIVHRVAEFARRALCEVELIRTVDLDTYVDMTRPQIEWVIKGLLPRPGIALLGGEPKEGGKSFFALQLALAIGQGEDFLGWAVSPKPHRVLYLQFDTSEFVWRDRLLGLRNAGVILAGDVQMVHPDDVPSTVNVLTFEGRTFLHEACQAYRPAVVILDVLREVHTADEDTSTEMKVVLDGIVQAVQYPDEPPPALVIIHHTRKLDPESTQKHGLQVVNAFRGSSYLTGRADTLWILHHGLWYLKPRFNVDMELAVRRTPTGFWTRA